MTASSAIDPARQKPVAIWLFAVAGLVALMVLVGGATRLTDSGLSITEWAPVTGAVPPLGAEAWAAEFEKYKAIPEYERVNAGMSLEEFKFIYWWEWGHRFLGRLIGLAFAVPMLIFFLTRRLGPADAPVVLGLFVLGGLQGVVGWWMVASGLVDRVDVSHYRLTAHLSLALAIFGALLWVGADYARRSGLWTAPTTETDDPAFAGPAAAALAAGVFVQIALGALVAGLRAGKTYNTWPLMDGSFVPAGYFAEPGRPLSFLESMGGVQFNHRLGAYILCAGALAFAVAVFRSGTGPRLRRQAALLGGLVVVQSALGIWTVLAAAPLALGLAHQAGALALFAVALSIVFDHRQGDRGFGLFNGRPARVQGVK
ncbi:MAG: COX15/CtaA family protein [Pseudomonadota bacterium]